MYPFFHRLVHRFITITNLSLFERLPVAAYQVNEGLQERPRYRLPDQILRAVQRPLQVGRHVARERREVVEGRMHDLKVRLF